MWARRRRRQWLAGVAALALCLPALLALPGAHAAGTAPAPTGTSTAPTPTGTSTTPTSTGPMVTVPVDTATLTSPTSTLTTPTTGTATTPTPTGPEQVQVQVGSTATSGPLPAGFLGFSIEYGALHAYLGRDPNALDPVFLQLLQGIDQGQAPILRVGGNSADDSWVALPGVLPPLAVNYRITEDWIATVHALVRAIDARLILGINLAADDPQIAGVEARALVDGIGSQYIEDLEVGNEPDLYLRYPWYYLPDGAPVTRRTDAYAFRGYATNLAQWHTILPAVPLAAGALATINWLGALDPIAATYRNVSMVTVHRYPLSNCGVSRLSPSYPTLANLLDEASTEGLAAPLAPYAIALHSERLNFRVDELNSASCEGARGVSNTFASALWMLNELFDMAAAGVDGINVHTLPGARYAPFSFTDARGRWTADVHPLYYGMLMFAAAFPPGAELLSVSDSSTAAGGALKAYSTEAADGRRATTLINEDATAATVQLELPGSASTLTEETLTAPSLSSTTGVRLGDRSFAQPTSTGTLAAPRTRRLVGTDGSFTIAVPADSAVLLTAGN